MEKIPDNFSGYLEVGDDTFVYNVANHIVTLLPAQSERKKIWESFNRINSREKNIPELFFGEDGNSKIAMLHNSNFNTSVFGGNPSVQFATPIIIKAAGNAFGFYNMLTQPWEKFHAITFYGGSINAICDPQMAVDRSDFDEYLNNDGARKIKVRPWDDYTRSVEFNLDGEKVKLTISVSQTGVNNNTEHMDACSLGELNSFIRFAFEDSQCFDKIGRYYTIVKSLIAILTKQNNIFFEVYLSQRNTQNQYFKTGYCKIYDDYENYCAKKWFNVIPIHAIIDYIPKLIESIVNNEVDSLLVLLPESNREINRISITNVQDLCTALEVAYSWSEKGKEKDILINELKKKIKKTISKFAKDHDEIDVHKETTISSAFQYLDYTLKQKILTMYNENRDIVDKVIAKRTLPQCNEANVASFVKLRNNKTHSGIVEWGNSANLYLVLLALLYVCLFRHINMPEEIIELVILQVF